VFSSKVKRSVAQTVLAAWAGMMLSPAAVLAQTPPVPQLLLKAHGSVQLWNIADKKWENYSEGVAREGQTFRCIEGGTLDGHVVGEGPSIEKIHLDSCTAIRFVRLNLSQQGNTYYCKGFGQISAWMSHDRLPIDDFKLEYPVGLEVFGKDIGVVPPGLPTDISQTTFQTPTAAHARLAIYTNGDSTARLFGLTFVEGIVQALNPANGTFIIKEDGPVGRLDTVTCRFFTQVAKPRLNERVMNETAAQQVNYLHVGDKVTVYGVATAGQTGSLPAPGMGAFSPSTPVNFQSTVIFPHDGQYIYGGSFVLTTPNVPINGVGVTANGASTLTLRDGQVIPTQLAGIQLLNVACEVGAEIFGVPPPVAPVVVGGSAIGLYILLGIGAAILLNNNNGQNQASP
jgi:hypothetical protein